MSYDVGIGDFDGNYTSNLGRLYHKHIRVEDRTGLQALDGLTGKQAFPVLSLAIDLINNEYCSLNGARAFRAEYDAPNGWGSTDGAILFLAQILAACAKHPRKKVRVWA